MATWAGDEMIVWGGYRAPLVLDYVPDGSRYDPLAEMWTALPSKGAPAASVGHSMVWTGAEALVVGVIGGVTDGAAFATTMDSWRPITQISALEPISFRSAVWTGAELLLWGGLDGGVNTAAVGHRYDPGSDAWATMSVAGALSPRVGHIAVWAGDEMIVWGGLSGPKGNGEWPDLQDGALYDPEADSWRPMSTVNAPATFHHTGVWTGTDLIVWGMGGGGRYNAATDTWTPMSLEGQPELRAQPSAVWTGSVVIFWGGEVPGTDGGPSEPMATGGVYDPGSDSWVPVSMLGAPAPRAEHTAVWTGTEMIIWGGRGADPEDGPFYGDGARYFP